MLSDLPRDVPDLSCEVGAGYANARVPKRLEPKWLRNCDANKLKCEYVVIEVGS